MLLSIRFNPQIKISEPFKLLVIKAVKLALYESSNIASEKSIFNTTKSTYNLKNEIAHIVWYYDLFVREINDSEYIPGISINKTTTGFTINDLSYKTAFKHLLNIFDYVYITDSITSQISQNAHIIIMMDEFVVIRKDL